MPSTTFLITTLAEYQTQFWCAVGLELRQRGHGVAFISFDDRSTDMLRHAGFATYSASEVATLADPGPAEFEANMQRYGMTPSTLWLSHERYTFAQYNTADLRVKMLRYLQLAHQAITAEQQPDRTLVMVQELGGFVSVVASYFAAHHKGVANWFIEPSFFRGRLFFLKDSFAAAVLPSEYATAARTEVQTYLRNTVERQAIAIPQKDSHQYRSAVGKIVNGRNLRRLLQKLVDKYVLGKHQEFGHIVHHVRVHARMVLNGLRLRRHYTPLNEVGPFIYYPLHVPADMALTLRSAAYLDQLALIEYLLRVIPGSHKLVIKEHPAMIGAIEAKRLLELMQRFDNLVLLPPSTNNFDVLRACDVVVSVNSKSGAEALLLNKPVLILGDAFYRNCPAITPVAHLTELPAAIQRALTTPAAAAPQPISHWFEHVWAASCAGELYVTTPNNVKQFTQSMLDQILRPLGQKA